MVLLDTCAIVEAFKVSPAFSPKTLEKIDKGACILSVSFAEIACKIKLGKLEMSVSPRELYQRLSQIQSLEMIDIGINEWLDAIELNWSENKDPADRMLVAFAKKRSIPIVTTDQKIKKFYSVVIW